MSAVTSSGTMLADVLAEIRTTLTEAELGLQTMDRLELLAYTEERLHRGFVARAPRSFNSGQYRDVHLARVVDTVEVDVAYRIAPTRQTECYDEALVLEEQVRRALTSRICSWGDRLAFENAERSIQGEDRSWLITTHTYSTRRDALMGG